MEGFKGLIYLVQCGLLGDGRAGERSVSFVHRTWVFTERRSSPRLTGYWGAEMAHFGVAEVEGNCLKSLVTYRMFSAQLFVARLDGFVAYKSFRKIWKK